MSKNTNARYHPVQVSLHWLVVILIFATFLLGKYMSGIPNESEKIPCWRFTWPWGSLRLW